MGRKVRVLVLIKCLDPGGAERLVTTMLQRRDSERFSYEVAYLVAGLDGLVGEITAAGVPVHCLGGRGNYDVRWWPRLRRLLIAGRFDVVHAHLSYAAVAARFAVRSLPPRRRPALVYTEHSVRNHLARPIRALAWATIGWDDRVLAVAETNRAMLPARVRERAEVVVHGVDRADCHTRASTGPQARRRLGVSDDTLLVVTVANLRPQKAYPTLLRAARILVEEGPPLQFVAAGGGPLRAELEALRDELRLGDTFRFLGFYPDTIGLCAAADIFVLASDYEAMPVAVMEAMTVGAAIVATAVGDVATAVQDGVTGRLVPPGDPVALAAVLRELATDPVARRRLGDRALLDSVRFDISRATERVEEIYAELAGGNR